ncbi:hypothetical protein OEZ86_008542 [Tetradesmus obliquus]|nr:hypothetical protein OEZ86_008542 [Tetradesmus obliquus]
MFNTAPRMTNAGQLSFAPAPNAYGTTTCNVTLVDSGGARSAGVPLTVVITPVNDPPTFTAGAAISAPANPGTYTVSGWASNISRGPNEDNFETGSLTFSVTGCTNTSGMMNDIPSVSTSGAVTYRVNVNNDNQLRTSTCQVALVDSTGVSSTRATLAISQTRCLANAAFIQRFGRCEFYTPVSIASRPGVEFAVFSLELWWDEADKVCMTIGKRLVKLTDPTMETQLHAAASNIAGSRYWIGLSDLGTEGSWRWTDNSLLSTSPWSSVGGPWRTGFPRANDRVNSCALKTSTKWIDANCSPTQAGNGFVCA